MVQLKIITIDLVTFGRNIHKYSSRIKFVCFSLLFYQLLIFQTGHQNFELYHFKVGAFFETQCRTHHAEVC